MARKTWHIRRPLAVGRFFVVLGNTIVFNNTSR